METFSDNEFGFWYSGDNLNPNDTFNTVALWVMKEIAKDAGMVADYCIWPTNQDEMLTSAQFTQFQLDKNAQEGSIQGRIDNLARSELKIEYIKKNLLSQKKLRKAQLDELLKIQTDKNDLKYTYNFIYLVETITEMTLYFELILLRKLIPFILN